MRQLPKTTHDIVQYNPQRQALIHHRKHMIDQEAVISIDLALSASSMTQLQLAQLNRAVLVQQCCLVVALVMGQVTFGLTALPFPNEIPPCREVRKQTCMIDEETLPYAGVAWLKSHIQEHLGNGSPRRLVWHRGSTPQVAVISCCAEMGNTMETSQPTAMAGKRADQAAASTAARVPCWRSLPLSR